MGQAIINKYFGSNNQPFQIKTYDNKMICEYTGLNFKELDNIEFYKYKLYRRDAWLYKQGQSEQGQEFLKDLKRFQQTKADEKISRVSVKD